MTPTDFRDSAINALLSYPHQAAEIEEFLSEPDDMAALQAEDGATATTTMQADVEPYPGRIEDFDEQHGQLVRKEIVDSLGRHSMRWVHPETGAQHETHPATGEPASTPAQAQEHTADALADAVEKSGVLKKFKKASAWMKDKTQKAFKVLEKRYGRKTAVAIFAAGQVASWGAFGIGLAAGVPIWIPSSVATVPFAAMAEVYKQSKGMTMDKNAEEVGDEMGTETLNQAQIDQLGQQVFADLMAEWKGIPKEMLAEEPSALESDE